MWVSLSAAAAAAAAVAASLRPPSAVLGYRWERVRERELVRGVSYWFEIDIVILSARVIKDKLFEARG